MAEQLNKTSELDDIAYHETGHAVMAYLLRKKFHSITIDSNKLDDETGGLFRLVHSKKRIDSLSKFGYSKEIEQHIRIILAGEVSVGIFSGQEKWDMSQADINASFRLVQNQCSPCEKEVNAYIDWLVLSVQNDLKLPQNWCLVCAVAQSLLEHKTLSYRKTYEIIKAAHDEYQSNPSFDSSLKEEPDESDEPVDFYF
jgi:hypothetical protein